MKAIRLFAIATLVFSIHACAQPNPSTAPAKPVAVSAKVNLPDSGDAIVRAALLKVAPGVHLSSIKPAPIAGFKEVLVDGKVVYVSNDGRYLMQGTLLELATRTNLTDLSEAVVRKGLLAAIPATRKISFAPENPKYRVTVFTDIDCGFCRRLHTQVDEYNRLGIAIDYLFFPRAGIGSESFQKAVNVWCASDRKVALTMAKNDRPLPKQNCGNFVTMDYNLGLQLGVNGTPAIYAQNGSQLGGYLSPNDLLKALQNLNK